jgi:hypothetical protein
MPAVTRTLPTPSASKHVYKQTALGVGTQSEHCRHQVQTNKHAHQHCWCRWGVPTSHMHTTGPISSQTGDWRSSRVRREVVVTRPRSSPNTSRTPRRVFRLSRNRHACSEGWFRGKRHRHAPTWTLTAQIPTLAHKTTQ